MSKEKPIKFDEWLQYNDEWDYDCCLPEDWDKVKMIYETKNYYYYLAYDNYDKEESCLYRNKKENVGDEDEDIITLNGVKYKRIEDE